MKKLVLLVQLIFIITLGYTQNASIGGTITDQENLTLPGASVIIKGTTTGAITDIDGNYKINNLSSGNYDLEISFIGFQTKSYTIDVKEGENKILNIEMGEDALNLKEVVVVGYGTRQKRDVTGSISSVKAKDIEDAVTPSVDQALQGKASGVQITAANGVAGGGSTKIQIRGTNSILAGSQPLIVIDGIPMNNSDMSADVMGSGTNGLADINMDDVASIDVLKDAASAAIYGARGANGVILITTKKGKEGKTKFDFNYKTGIVSETNRLELLNAEQHLSLRDQRSLELYGEEEDKTTTLGIYEGVSYTRADADSFAAIGGSDWIDNTLQMGSFHEANLSASGGTEKNRFYLSGAYRNEESFLIGNDFERIAARLNIDNKAHDVISLGANVGVTYSINNRVPTGDNGGLGWAQQIPTYIPIYNADGTYFNQAGNPLWYLENHSFIATRFRNLSNLYTDIKISKELTFHSGFGLDLTHLFEEEFMAENLKANSDAYAHDRTSIALNWNTTNYLTYAKIFKEKHDINAVIGSDLQSQYIKGQGIYGSGFSNNYFTTPSQASNQGQWSYENQYAIISYYTRLSYKLNNKYLLNLTVRSDGSSRFADNHKYGFFPSASAGWIISDEDFINTEGPLNFLKLKTSYGITGNDNIPNYAYLALYSTNPNGYNGSQAIFPTSLENPDLRWEKARMLDVTLDYGFFNSKISGNITYFNKRSDDLLLPIQLPTSSGFGSLLVNVGALNNWGIEYMLTSHNMNKGDFEWTTDFNYSRIRNKVLDAANQPPDAFESGQPGEGRVIVDFPVGQTYVVRFAGIMETDGTLTKFDEDGNIMYDENGNEIVVSVSEGEALFLDLNGNLMAFGVDDKGTSDNSDDVNRYTGSSFYDNRVPRGNPNPKFYAGLTNTFKYKAFELSGLINIVWGHTIYDDPAKNQIGMINQYAQRTEILDTWTSTNNSNIPSLSTNTQAINSDRFLYDGSFIRLRSLTLSYTIPKNIASKMKVNNLKLYATGYNLLTWTKYPGWDPEVMRHVPQNSQQANISFSGPSWQTPQAKILLIGLKLGLK